MLQKLNFWQDNFFQILLWINEFIFVFGPFFVKKCKIHRVVHSMATYLRGLESASVEILPFRPKFTQYKYL